MPFFSETILYHSPLSKETIVLRLSKEVNPYKLSLIEVFTEPSRYFIGRVNGGRFKLSYYGGRSFSAGPDIEGTIHETETGCIVNVKISYPGFGLLILVLFIVITAVTINLGGAAGEISFVFSVIYLIVSAISFKWKSSQSKVLLENTFKATGQVQ